MFEDDDDTVPPGFLGVGSAEDGSYVIVHHPKIETDHNGCGHIYFTPAQAREFARMLLECADECDIAAIPRC